MGWLLMQQIYSCEYEINGKRYSMHICGTYEEALSHADNLGLDAPEKVEAVIQEELNRRLN